MRNIPEERTPQLHPGVGVKSRSGNGFVRGQRAWIVGLYRKG